MKKLQKQTTNIGIVCSPWLGGSGVVGSELAKYLSKKDRYKIVFIGDDFPFRLEKNDIIFHKVEKLHHALFTHPLSEAALTEGIVAAVVKYKLTIIHAHFAIPFAHSAVQAKDILKKMGIHISVVTTLHGTDALSLGRETPATMSYILDQSDVVTAVSLDLAVKTKKLYNFKNEMQVVYNFVDFKQLKKNHVQRSKFANANEKILVHISNFRLIKRVTDTLKVFLKLHTEIPSVLLLIGEGPDIEAAKKLAKSMKKQDSIHFIGRVKNPYKYLQIADALLVTSTYESFCLAALEAIVNGVPVFGTRVGGIPEVIEHGKSGYLVNAGDVDAMSNHMAQHFLDEKSVLRMKKQARTLSKSFTAEKIIPQYEYIYDKLVLSATQNKSVEFDTMPFYVYILRTSSNTLYIGQTNNLEKRLKEHQGKTTRSAKYMKYFSSCTLVYSEIYATRSEAMKREWQLKKLTKAQKESLIHSDVAYLGEKGADL